MIRIWKYDKAPESFRELYPEGSVDTWVVEVPGPLLAEMEETMRLRGLPVHRLAKRELANGSVLFFGQTAPLSEGKASGSF